MFDSKLLITHFLQAHAELLERPNLPVPPSTARGCFKSSAEDFQVHEELFVELTGTGEHLWLCLTKINLTTLDVVHWLAKALQVATKDVSYSGLKDKLAKTTQWFSVCLPKKELTQSQLDMLFQSNPQLSLIHFGRHEKKLRRGTHDANAFTIKIRQLSGDLAELENRLRDLIQFGTPNYFGPQRFGNEQSTLSSALNWLLKSPKPGRVPRQRRSMWLSATRSALFNKVLAQRVVMKNWNKVLPGELVNLNGTGSVFPAERATAQELSQRLLDWDIHPTGILVGTMESQSCPFQGQSQHPQHVVTLERKVLEPWMTICSALAEQGLRSERRSLRLRPENASWALEGDTLCLSFSLPAGCFATTILKAMMEVSQA
jgi:tRNA pseudouridine13 synthase